MKLQARCTQHPTRRSDWFRLEQRRLSKALRALQATRYGEGLPECSMQGLGWLRGVRS